MPFPYQAELMRGGTVPLDLHLTSTQNPRIKQIVHLRDKHARDQAQKFLIEGYREILRAFLSGHPIEELYVCRELFLGSNEENLISDFERQVFHNCIGLRANDKTRG